MRLCNRVMRPQSEGTRLSLAVARHPVSGKSIGYFIGWTIAATAAASTRAGTSPAGPEPCRPTPMPGSANCTRPSEVHGRLRKQRAGLTVGASSLSWPI